MLLRIANTGSDGNAMALENDNGIVLIEAGIPIGDIKKLIDYQVDKVTCALISHEHKDHSLSEKKLINMGIPTYTPYKNTVNKRQKTRIDDFVIESFPIPHNGVENRGFIITVEGQKICYMCDLEYNPYNFKDMRINTLIVECNYISELVNPDLPNLEHKVIGHCSLDTTIGIIDNCKKHLRKVVLVHMSKGETFNKELAMQRIKEKIPSYIDVEFAAPNKVIDLSEIPF